jgi:hypothetical protein
VFPEYGLITRSPMLPNIQRSVDQVHGWGDQSGGSAM